MCIVLLYFKRIFDNTVIIADHQLIISQDHRQLNVDICTTCMSSTTTAFEIEAI